MKRNHRDALCRKCQRRLPPGAGLSGPVPAPKKPPRKGELTVARVAWYCEPCHPDRQKVVA